MSNVDSFLDTPADDFKAPPLYPVGTYVFTVVKRQYGESSGKKTPYVEFELLAEKALEDVNALELAKIDDFGSREFSTTFYLTEKSIFRLTKFLKAAGVDTSRSTRECIEAVIGRKVCGYLHHEIAEAKSAGVGMNAEARVFARVETFAPVV